MHTHAQHYVLTTISGRPVRPSHVIACTPAKNPSSLRITMDTGEVIQDTWPSAEDAAAFQEHVTAAMRGLTQVTPRSQASLPPWATYSNAAIAAQAVADCGGTRESAAQVYARTLFGEGQPAQVIDGELILRTFADAPPDGPVFVLAGMPEPDHSRTKLPFTRYSPLVGLAIVAVDQGIDPERMRFTLPDRPEDYRVTEDELKFMAPSERAEYREQLYSVRKFDEEIGRSVAVTLGSANDRAFRQLHLPRKVYYNCPLARRFFGAWVGLRGPLVEWAHPEYEGAFKQDNPAHRAVLRKLVEHFELQGYEDAAANLKSELA